MIKQEILQRAKIYNKKAGVYFLILNEEIVYIGSTLNLDYRIQEHLKEKIFDSYSFFEIGKDLFLNKQSLLEYENDLIIQFNPKYNKTILKAPGYLHKTELKKHGINIKFIKKYYDSIKTQTYNGINFYYEDDILFLISKYGKRF